MRQESGWTTCLRSPGRVWQARRPQARRMAGVAHYNCGARQVVRLRHDWKGCPMHDWDVTVEEAVAIQRRLRGLVQTAPEVALDRVRIVAGVDASYKDVARAAVVALSFPALDVLETAVAVREIPFPYVPGLLSFREA